VLPLAIAILFGTFTGRYAELGRKRGPLINSLKACVTETQVQGERFGLVTKSSTLQKEILLITQTKHDYVSIISKFGLKRIGADGSDPHFLKSIAAARKRRVRIRIIAEIDEENSKSARGLARYAEIRTLRNLLFCLDIADMREMIFGPAMTGEETGGHYTGQDDLWTNNSRFIRGMHAMFEKLWSTSPRYLAKRASYHDD
jgi:hypothetical protein